MCKNPKHFCDICLAVKLFGDLEMEEQPDEMDPGGAGAAEKRKPAAARSGPHGSLIAGSLFIMSDQLISARSRRHARTFPALNHVPEWAVTVREESRPRVAVL